MHYAIYSIVLCTDDIDQYINSDFESLSLCLTILLSSSHSFPFSDF